MRLVIIGGSDAGISAALRARECRPGVEVHLILADAYPNYSICGLPFCLSDEVRDWRSLAHRTSEEIEAAGVQIHLKEEASHIDVARKSVLTRAPDGRSREHSYDRLVIATGATPDRSVHGPHHRGKLLDERHAHAAVTECVRHLKSDVTTPDNDRRARISVPGESSQPHALRRRPVARTGSQFSSHTSSA